MQQTIMEIMLLIMVSIYRQSKFTQIVWLNLVWLNLVWHYIIIWLKLYFWMFKITASANGHLECVEFLITKGADINNKDRNGWTSLISGI